MNPYKSGEEIRKAIVQNMHFFYPVADAFNGHPDGKRFKDVVDKFPYVTEPFLETIPFYKKDQETTLDSLKEYLHPKTIELFSAYWTGKIDKAAEVYLYKHQSEAIRHFYDNPDEGVEGSNLLVCTGTGSGKTETFLIPLIDGVIRAREKGEENGIKAMLLYPMNALVNDQIRRLRDILRCAEKLQIKWAKDITFGQYTGNVATVSLEDMERQRRRRDLTAERQMLQDVCNNIDSIPEEEVEHPYFDSDAYIKNEYRSRRRWEREGADIIITNYAMLERLMLDPEKDEFFSKGSWKYIILDEAHSYDGSLGTEIAWLLRRLLYRVSTNGRSRKQFIATSATMGSLDMARCFAGNLFNARPESFKVLQGELQPDEPLPAYDGDCIADITYSQLFQGNEKAIEGILNYIRESMPESLQPDFSKVNTLHALTQWVNSFKEWLKEFRPLDSIPQVNSAMAVGDLLAYAGLVAKLKAANDGIQDFEFRRPYSRGMNAIIRIVQTMSTNKTELVKRAIRECTGIASFQKINDMVQNLANLTEHGARPVVLAPSEFRVAVYVVTKHYSDLMDDVDYAEANICNVPLRWRVLLGQHNYDVLHAACAKKRELEEILAELHKLLLQAWAKTSVCQADNIADMITTFLSSKTEYNSLISCFKGNPHPTWNEVREYLRLSDEDLSAFLQLLPLSSHPVKHLNKPLRDLRFHQAVKGISSIALYFDRMREGHFIANDERSLIDGYPAYSLGFCRNCAQPYIIGYQYQENGQAEPRIANKRRRNNVQRVNAPADQWRILRYEDIENTKPVALRWIPSSEKDEPKYQLGIQTGQLRCFQGKDDQGKDDSEWLNIYERLQADDDSRMFSQCPCCEATCQGAESVNNLGVLDIYKTGASMTRNVALYQMACQADSVFGVSDAGKGRKVLAFSDSRRQAASTAASFEWFEEMRILNELILSAMQAILNERVGKREERIEVEDSIRKYKERLSQEVDGDVRALFQKKLDQLELKKAQFDSPYCTLEEIRDKVKIRLEALRSHAFMAIPYKEDNNTSIKTFPTEQSVALAVLSALRAKGRNTLLAKGHVEVCSAAQLSEENNQTDKWNQWCGCFGDEGQSRKCFQAIYRYIFERALLDCHMFDNEYGHLYSKATNAEGEEKRYVDGLPKFPSNMGCLYFRQERLRARDNCILLDGGAERTKVYKLLKEYGCTDYAGAVIRLKELMRDDLKSEENNDDTMFRLRLGQQRFKLRTDRLDKYRGELPEQAVFRIEEHTAQISNTRGQLYQKLFSDGQVNILSCSTTFEMGVDLGALNCVFLCNMPPTVANYTQRAGRAGRRAGSASYVLTCIGGSSHDAYFCEHPKELFFGEVETPKIYLENETYRAAHLRAEAMHAFLDYCKKDGTLAGWGKSGIFFMGYEAISSAQNHELRCLRKSRRNNRNYALCSMDKWLLQERDTRNLQAACEEIAGDLPYVVAADLYYQILGDDEEGKVVGWLNDYNPEYLAGPNGKREDMKPVLMEYQSKLDSMLEGIRFNDRGDSQNPEHYDPNWKNMIQAAHNIGKQTIEYLSQNHVLPLYGFPCDVIELMTDDKDVSLTRSKKQAIFEYAMGKRVIANKKVYKSLNPIFYVGHRPNGQVEVNRTSYEKKFYRCRYCNSFNVFRETEEGNCKCPACGRTDNVHNPHTYCSPDAFQGDKGVPCTEEIGAGMFYREFIYEGGDDGQDSISVANSLLVKPASRTLIYVNARCRYEPEDRGVTYAGLYHQVQADVVIVRPKSPVEAHPTGKADGDSYAKISAANRNAWESAAQAYARAAALVLKVKAGDISAFSQSTNGQYSIVLFDDTSNGSGVLLKMMPKEPGAAELHRRILEKALELCTSCNNNCHDLPKDKEGSIPISHAEYLSKIEQGQDDPYREYSSCYSCLRSYRNQRDHARLDAHDASVILHAMLGNGNESGGMQQIAEHDSAADGCVVQPLPEASGSAQSGATTKQPIKLTPEVLQQLTQGILQPPVKLLVKLNNNETQARFTGRDRQSNLIVKINDTKRIFSENDMKTIMWEN